MKLQKRANSKSTAERMDRDFCKMMGIKYPIIPARKYAKMAKSAYFEHLSDVCPN